MSAIKPSPPSRRTQQITNLVIAMLLLAGLTAAGGYYFGQQQGQNNPSSTQAATTQTASYPAITPTESLRNLLGNFYLDDTFTATGYQQSPALTANFVQQVGTNSSKQISVVTSFFCAKTVPTKITFDSQPVTGQTSVVTGHATYNGTPNQTITYNLVLDGGRWKLDSVVCAKSTTTTTTP